MKKTNKRTPTVFYVGILLLCLVSVSGYLMNGLYAKYLTTDASTDSARVAAFSVTIEPDVSTYSQTYPLDKLLLPGKEMILRFTVTNNSEVAVAFHFTAVNLTGNLPLDIPLSGTAEANVPSFSGNLAPSSTESFDVSILWDGSSDDPIFAGKTDLLELRVVAEQLD